MLEDAVEIAEPLDELGRRLDPDARDPRHVVGRVARERLDVDHPLRRDAELLLDLGGADLAILEIIVEHDLVVLDELHQVLVR